MPTVLAESAPDAASYERAVLQHFATTVGFDVAFFATVAGGAPTAIGLDAARLDEAFATRRYDHEVLPLKHVALEARGVVVDTEVLGVERVRRSAYHRELAAPVGGRHSLLAYALLRGRPLGLIMLGRTGSTFATRDLARVAEALPAIALGRASYHAPFVSEPLPPAPAVARARAWMLGDLTRDGSLSVRDRDGYREMLAGDFIWTRASLEEPRRSAWFYVDLFHLAAARARRRARALFIGCGGAVAIRQFAETYPGITLDVVELDPRVVDLAHEWYDLARIPNLSVHLGDGAEVLARAAARTWDVIVVDAYGEDHESPLTERSFFRELGRVLTRGGAVAFNAIGSLARTSPVRVIERAMRAELSDVRLVPVLDADEDFSPTATRNLVLVASA